MTLSTDPNHPGLKEGDAISAYTVKRTGEIREISAFFYELEHLETGARHFHISRADAENTFGVAFKTVPTDSTGVAHILEHTALCGSAKYPVRDPFFSMLKRSLSTFMNAFTAADWTMYPFSTENRKDFYNLMSVYLDAAFFPKLEELSFKQEGHRMELESDPDNPGASRLVFKGVVYNEMKGAMSSPDQVLVRSLMNALYPDTTYRNNSGGDPDIIPELTYEQLRAFHRHHYHPSNSFFYTYGNMPLAEHLAFIHDHALGSFQRIDPGTDVPLQPRWPEPKRVTCPYPLGETEDAAKKYQVCVAWLTADIRDSFDVLVMTLLGQILLGNAAAPLRKALIDSGLGTALSDGTGYDSDNRDTLFAAGLKDVRKADAETIEAIVLDVLETLATEGIESELIESAIHQLEFHRKEVTNSPYPYGIKLLLAFAGAWMHGGQPERILKLEADLERLRDELERGRFFEEKIRSVFLENPHRVVFTLEPDQEMEARANRRTADRLQERRAALSDAELTILDRDAGALAELQDAAEDISCLPTLELEDIPPSVKRVAPSRITDWGAAYEQPTSGIFYFSAAAGIAALDVPLHPLLPFFCHAATRVGTRLRDYSELVRRIDAYTGGIGLGAHARIAFDGSGTCIPFVSFNGKCLDRNQDKLFDIIREVSTEYDFSDRERVKNLLMEYRASLESMVVHNGHRLAMSLASRRFSLAGSLSESWHGVGQLRFIKGLTDDLTDEKLEALSEDLADIGRTVFVPDNLKIALIGDPEAVGGGSNFVTGSRELSEMSGPLSDTAAFQLSIQPGENGVPREGWVTSTSVSFVASAFKTVRLEHGDAPALAAAAKLLRSMYLHREIREKGGAYGGFALYNPETGLFCFGSYRDPHILATLNAYEGASDFIRSGSYTEEDIKETVLQVCSEIDKPDPPGPEARKAFYRKIILLSDESRERFKSGLLRLTRERMMGVAEKYFGPERDEAVAVISGAQQLKAANHKLGDRPLTVHQI